MHIRHGQLRWEQAVAPAERLARFGVPVSRALSRDLQAGASLVGADREEVVDREDVAAAGLPACDTVELAQILEPVKESLATIELVVTDDDPEFAPGMRVVLATIGGLRNATTLRELLPDAFLPTSLPR